MKLSLKNHLINKDIISKESFMNKLRNKKVIAVICILLVVILGFTIYKVKFSKPATTQSTVKYTMLKKTNIATTINSSGAIKSGDSTNIYSNLQYNVSSINVQVGDVVKKGDVLATIDTTTLEEQIAEAQQSLTSSETKNQLSLTSAKQKYENLKYLYDNNLNTDIIDGENSLESAKLDLEKKTKAYDFNKVMYDKGEISQQDLNDKKIDYETAKNNYDKASASLEAKKINAKQSLDEAKTAYDNAKASADDKSNRLAFEDKKKKLEDAKVIATVDGTVTNVNAVVGVQASGALFVIQDLGNLIVNASVDETDVGKVKVGQKARITTDVTGNEIIEGQVINVEPVSSTQSASNSSTSSSTGKTTTSTTSNSTSSDVSFTVKIQLKGQSDKVKVGMNSVVNIVTNEKANVYAVPYGAIVNNNGESVIYVAEKTGDKYVVKEVSVTKGMESDTSVEIDGSDLSEGMIVLSEPANYKVGDTVTIERGKFNK
ncbi:efflux RND transporter periplasmic adaptor subunit [Clostridium sp. C2-6-12]|uniref:HlyD family secretion protein n=1 Tax=Clostridium sp. C2-6-12 TaxID=2698832 RepID=UPI001FAC1465|nr:efflux RND transporter periplasmic adaptor subunit [Clostridium sp. C2-6-12]